MNEEQRRILNLLSEGKLTAEEAEGLLDAISGRARSGAGGGTLESLPNPKYLRVLVENEDAHASKVNVRVPFDLIRAGVRLAALLPTAAYEPVNRALKQNGVDIDVSKLRTEDLDALVQHLRDLTVDVENGNGEKVRVFCE
jgi:hypothetical protein